jgi:transketolase
MGLAGRVDSKGYRVYVLLGDGELDEGSVWEAAMAASHYGLDTIIALVDRNCLQISGSTEECLRLEPLVDRWKSFGWDVVQIDGHDIVQILESLGHADAVKGKPALIIAQTVKGRGIPFLENRKESHSCALSDEEYEQIMNEL